MSDLSRDYYLKGKNSYTSFAERIVTSATPILELKSNYGISDLRDRIVTTAGTVTNGDNEYNLQTNADGTGSVALESAERGRYIPGYIAVPGLAVRIPSLPTGNQIYRWGYFDNDNGFGFQLDAGGLKTFIRNNGNDLTKERTNWLYDSLDGTGLSGYTLDFTKVNIFRFPFRWYGSGPIDYEISTENYDRVPELTVVDRIYDNQEAGPIVKNPNLPLKAEVTNNGTASQGQMFVLGRQFFIYGTYVPQRRITSDYVLGKSVGTTNLVPLISFRQKTAFKSVSIKINGANVVTDTNIRVVVLIGNELSGTPSWATPSDIPASETALEFDSAATGFTTKGIKQHESIVVGGSGSVKISSANVDFPRFDMPSNGTIITLAAIALSSTATVDAVFRAAEEW